MPPIQTIHILKTLKLKLNDEKSHAPNQKSWVRPWGSRLFEFKKEMMPNVPQGTCVPVYQLSPSLKTFPSQDGFGKNKLKRKSNFAVNSNSFPRDKIKRYLLRQNELVTKDVVEIGINLIILIYSMLYILLPLFSISTQRLKRQRLPHRKESVQQSVSQIGFPFPSQRLLH